MLFYAGIGSRQTPDDVCQIMIEIGERLADLRWGLRSGGAAQADIAFETGCDRVFGHKEIFLATDAIGNVEAHLLAERYHPAWENCSWGARQLHARNGFIILGRQLCDPVKFVVCWTKNGKPIGGTGQGIRMGLDMGIPVFNLYNKSDLLKMWQLVEIFQILG